MTETIQYKRDGNQWCCHDSEFINLQESNAGFGDTKQEALADFRCKSLSINKGNHAEWIRMASNEPEYPVNSVLEACNEIINIFEEVSGDTNEDWGSRYCNWLDVQGIPFQTASGYSSIEMVNPANIKRFVVEVINS